MAAPQAWLQVCPADTPMTPNAPHDTAPWFPLSLPDSPALHLRAGPQLPNCRGVALPVPPEQIAAVRTATPSDRVADARTVLIYRPEPATPAFGSVETILPPAVPDAAAARTAAPLRSNFAGQLQWRSYGVEERVQAHIADGRLAVQCRGGAKPAGVLLSAPWTMPQAALALAVQYRADGAFALSLADDAASHDERSMPLGQLGPAAGAALLPLPASGWDPAHWRHFVLACPDSAATLAIDSLQLQLRPSAALAPARATWIWRSKEWLSDPAKVLAKARRHGMRTLFITVPTQGATVPQSGRLAAFAKKAAAAGIALWAVEGDPHMALPDHHAATTGRLRAFAAYNRKVEPAARLHGVQFDIEPYLIDGYGTASARFDHGYAQLLAQLRAAAQGMPLDFVVPFWWRSKDTLLDALAHAASIVTVMDYRTDEEQIRSFAEPFLDWGVRHRVDVRIALESGAIGPERQHRYVRAGGEPAELWAIPLMPQDSGLAAPLDVLVLLKQPQTGLPGMAFRYSGNRLLDGSATTFQRQPERLRALLPRLEQDFSAWPSFAGMAVHEPWDAVTAPVPDPVQDPAQRQPTLPPSSAR
ncbi:hypothetical protein GCM10027277_23300 [Pseudoduganella ginsengisoli]|uniref:Uncharacterized protein n=1 Tax=Pseudoduganella ginsengisoli TaxID=1462440 RepID=A0A6L6Q6X6_9BURK|nr:hypothetical protein [Pseudoduganella ginsengisoli]MTW05410.1 hypothetical protein [Pseudoduganella ginsengisoli]